MAKDRDLTPETPLTQNDVDSAIRQKNPAKASEEERPAVLAVLQAFALFSEGKDEPAREALNAIGMKSAANDWKLLLRGLMAFHAADDPRALENWRRLDPNRLPARIAAPFRAKIEESYSGTLHPRHAARVRGQYRKLQLDTIGDALYRIKLEVEKDDPLNKAFTISEKLSSIVRTKNPDVWKRLGQVFYWEVLRSGNPEDMPKHLRIFGRNELDPDYHRMNAIGFGGDPPQAVKYWLKYEAWLATGLPHVPEALVRAMRAEALGEALHYTDMMHSTLSAPPDLMAMLLDSFGQKAAKTMKSLQKEAATGPKPEELTDRLMALDPLNSTLILDRMEQLIEREAFREASSLGEKYVAHGGQDIEILKFLSKACSGAGDFEKGMKYLDKVRELNPLDKSLDVDQKGAVINYVVSLTEKADSKGILKATESWKNDPVTTIGDIMITVSRALAFLVDKDSERYQATLDTLGERQNSASVLLIRAIHAKALKLKPAVCKPFDAALTALWKSKFTVGDCIMMLSALILWTQAKFSFRGDKTYPGKVMTQMIAAIKTATHLDVATLLMVMSDVGRIYGAKSALKILDQVSPLFVNNALILVLCAELVSVGIENGEPGMNHRKFMTYKRSVLRSLKHCKPEEQKQALERLEQCDPYRGNPFFL
ncbi:MAG: tetratricopeptide repeat protein [Fimbriiglobus sp.]